MSAAWREVRLWWCSVLLGWLTSAVPDPTPSQLKALKELAWAVLGDIEWDEDE